MIRYDTVVVSIFRGRGRGGGMGASCEMLVVEKTTHRAYGGTT